MATGLNLCPEWERETGAGGGAARLASGVATLEQLQVEVGRRQCQGVRRRRHRRRLLGRRCWVGSGVARRRFGSYSNSCIPRCLPRSQRLAVPWAPGPVSAAHQVVRGLLPASLRPPAFTLSPISRVHCTANAGSCRLPHMSPISLKRPMSTPRRRHLNL